MVLRFFMIVLVVLVSNLVGQDLGTCQKLLEEGKIEELESALPNLIAQYPDEPFVLYLQAAINSGGDEAITQLRTILKDHPNTLAAELALMKIGEYLYSKGLYSQASEQLKLIPLHYPESKQIERAVSLLKKSYLATGETDSIEAYLEIFRKKYPNLNFTDYDYYSALINPVTEQAHKTMETEKVNKETETESQAVKIGEKPWVVQVGAFRDKNNAETIANRLKAAGYAIELFERQGELSLYLVQIVRFSTLEEAIITGEEVSDKFGLEFRILERN